tara:strand:- start:54 stop:554 length:501 start_codon:yes stop_codon:yes gene_type:complete
MNFINNNFIDIFSKGWTLYEFLLNILFISLLIIIGSIIYWDSINKKISNKSRCKKQRDIYDKNNGVYILNVKNKTGNNLFNIKYDFEKKIQGIDCACNKGDINCKFEDINYRNLKKNENMVQSKVCSCDNVYTYDIHDAIYEGPPELIRYMIDSQNSIFFDKNYFK